ncbi:MAG: hypothetical protein ACTS8S_11665 [Giesbergeria sp.]
MTPIQLFALILITISGPVSAEVEKVAAPADSGIALRWWPKVQPPQGWHFDRESSHHFGFNAMAPDGSTFSAAETVMYAKANYKPREPQIKTLKQLVEHDFSRFRQSYPDITVVIEPSLHSADHKPLQVVTFAPSTGANWERVAYGEAHDFYVLFTVSSRTKDGFEFTLPAFKSMVASYSVAP